MKHVKWLRVPYFGKTLVSKKCAARYATLLSRRCRKFCAITLNVSVTSVTQLPAIKGISKVRHEEPGRLDAMQRV